MKNVILWAFSALLVTLESTAWSQTPTFYKFAPATGILKGSTQTYVTTAASSADIRGLWSGTCDATTFLRGDGACALVSSSPGGSNTQVQFNNSSFFGGSSNFTWDNTNNALTLTGSGGGILQSPAAKPLNLEGGSIIGLYTNGAGTARALVNSDGGITVGSPTGGSQGLGTINMGGCFVNGVACSTGGAAGANPTATVGLTSIPGSAGTFMRSDASPALSQLISPNMTGNWTFSPTSTATQFNYDVSIGTSGGQGSLTGTPGGELYVNRSINDIHQMQVVNTNSGINAIGKILFGVSGTGNGNGALVGTSSTAAAYQAGGPTGPQVILHTGQTTPIVIGTHDTARIIVDGNGTDAAFTLPIYQTSGSVTVPSYAFTSGTQTGMWLKNSGPDTLAFSVGGAEVIRSTSSSLTIDTGAVAASSNVTLNQPASGTVLTVKPVASTPAVEVQAAAGNIANIVLEGNGASFGTNDFAIFQNTDSQAYIVQRANANLNLQTNGTNRIIAYNDGGVAVGSPTGADKGTGSLNAQALYVNGSPVLTGSTSATRFAAGVLTVTGSGSCLAQNTANISSCTSSGAGLAHVTFSSAFSSATCTASPVDSSPVLIATNPGTSVTSTADFDLRNASSALTNGSLSITCIGN